MFYIDRTEAIRGFMPRYISLLQHMLACSNADRCQVLTGLTSFYDPDRLVLNVRKGSVKFGGLMKKICYILCYIKCFFPVKVWVPIQCNLRHVIKRLAQDFLPVLPVFLLRRSAAMTKINQHFKAPGTHM